MADRTEARDPVCDMVVEIETAPYRSIFQGETFYFCSSGCQQTFEANPAYYAARAASRSDRAPADKTRVEKSREPSDPPFTKRFGIVSPKFGAAGSGGLEYEPLPEPRRDDDTDTR